MSHTENAIKFKAAQSEADKAIEAVRNELQRKADAIMSTIPKPTLTTALGEFTFSIDITRSTNRGHIGSWNIIGYIEPFDYNRKHDFAGLTLQYVSVEITKHFNRLSHKVKAEAQNGSLTSLRQKKLDELMPSIEVERIVMELFPHLEAVYLAQHYLDMRSSINGRDLRVMSYNYEGQI